MLKPFPLTWEKGYKRPLIDNSLYTDLSPGFVNGTNFIIDDGGNIAPRPSPTLLYTTVTTDGPVKGVYLNKLDPDSLFVYLSSAGHVCIVSKIGVTQLEIDLSTGATPAPIFDPTISTIVQWEGYKVIISSTEINAIVVDMSAYIGSGLLGGADWNYLVSRIKTAPATNNTKGYCATHENRLVIGSGNVLYYSDRDNFDSGYAIVTGSEQVKFDSSDKDIVGLIDVSGALYILMSGHGTTIYRKGAVMDEILAIDSSQFMEVISDLNCRIKTQNQWLVEDGVLYVWLDGKGLCRIHGDNLVDVSERVQETVWFMADSSFTVILVPIGNGLVGWLRSGTTVMYVFDTKKNIWYSWVDDLFALISGIIYGNQRMLFCVSGVTDAFYSFQSGSYTTTDISVSINFPATNFSLPGYDKYFRRLLIDGACKTSTNITVVIRGNTVFRGTPTTIVSTTIDPTQAESISKRPNKRAEDLQVTISGTNLYLRGICVIIDIRRMSRA